MRNFNLRFLLLSFICGCRAHPPGFTVNVTLPAEALAQLGAEKSAIGSNVLRATRGPCTCLDGVCKCCTGLSLASLGQDVCANMEYDPDEFQISVSMSMNDKTYFKRTMSGKNPRPFCVPLPRLRFITMCTKLSNVFLTGRNIHACIDMEGKMFDVSMFSVSFDCVRIGDQGLALVSPEDGGGLPNVEAPQKPSVDEDYDQLDYEAENQHDDKYEPTPIPPTKNKKGSTTKVKSSTSRPTTPKIIRIQTSTENGKTNNNSSAPSASTQDVTFIKIEETVKNSKRQPRE
ncbi:uncharacterized protein LOC132203545 [Neocloeon triangulifer]|uniref:uncharacterized protein LOC132203545 n=1 Tax=Neocloeon triangulifer TaxID=2078957 RepID=UPI00286FA628|nr:uncharacterized protein LOC132203545 [Neocloeon triangulifer]